MDIWISDYYKYDDGVFHESKDLKDIDRIRIKLDSFKDECDQYQWIYERRQSDYLRREDQRLFGIPLDAEANRSNFIHKENEYWNGEESDPETEQKSSESKTKNIVSKFKSNFLVKNIKAILLISGALIVVILIGVLIIYVAGTAGSSGHTPFVLCGEDEISGGTNVQLPSAEIEEMASPEYVTKAFIVTAKSKGWKDTAIVGTLAYLLAEGTSMGTFTYESNPFVEGPSGVKMDKTLDNDKWLKWLKSEKTMNDQIYAYRNTSYYKNGRWAMGLGLTQESDVYKCYMNGGMEDNGATKLIEAANAAGKFWQDPAWQMEYVTDTLFVEHSDDSDYIDPKVYTGSSDEYCRRVSTFIGMPNWNWTKENDSQNYMADHRAKVPEAEAAYKNFTGDTTISSISSKSSGNPCQEAGSVSSGGNASLADAAVSLASEDITKILWDGCDYATCPALQNPRLATYKKIHMQFLPNDQYFASCDRGVATAVLWAGVDMDFPAGDTTVQWSYLSNSPKWKNMGNFGSVDMKPGDILITHGNGHIKMYVGNEAIQKRFPGSTSDMYSASYHQYFPHVYKDGPGYDGRAFAVFRNIKSDNAKGGIVN